MNECGRTCGGKEVILLLVLNGSKLHQFESLAVWVEVWNGDGGADGFKVDTHRTHAVQEVRTSRARGVQNNPQDLGAPDEVAPGLEPAPQDRVKDLKRQTDQVIDTLDQNMKRLVKREENLEGLEYISMELEETKVFKQTAQKVKRSYWWKSVKLVVVVVVVVLVIVLVLVLVIVLLAKGVIPKP
ncbi:unnamed protein product [Boreogadus saida]